MGSITHKPKTGALLTGTEYEAADAHTVTLTASDVGAAATAHVHSGADITSGTVADGNIAATIARDSEVTTAVSNHVAAADPHTEYVREASAEWVDLTDGGSTILHTHAGGSGAPTTVDYLVGTADAGLSNEIVVGTSPGGELGGTWASPTVDASHSGSTHAATQAAAEATAAGALSAHTAAGDPHPVYLTAAEGDAAYQPLDSDLTSIAALATTAFGRALLTLADAGAMLATSGALASVDNRIAVEDPTFELAGTARQTLGGSSELFFATNDRQFRMSAAYAQSVTVPNGYWRLQFKELRLTAANRLSCIGTSDFVLTDLDDVVVGRLVLTGRS